MGMPATMTDCVIDLSHNNAVTDPDAAYKAAAAAGIALVFEKATQGVSFTDPTFAARRQAAAAQGLLFGAYHFCDGSDPIAQADFFLGAVGDPKGVLLALDAERNASQVTIAELVLVASRIYRRIGVWPGIYMGRLGPTNDGSGLPAPVISKNCWLWLPEYGDNPICPAGWDAWTFWQHTDGQIGSAVAPVPGIGPCDRSCYAGTVDQLKAWHAAQTGAVA